MELVEFSGTGGANGTGGGGRRRREVEPVELVELVELVDLVDLVELGDGAGRELVELVARAGDCYGSGGDSGVGASQAGGAQAAKSTAPMQ